MFIRRVAATGAILLAAGGFAPALAHADAGATLYVDNTLSSPGSTCSDTGPGTKADPYCSIQAAVAVAAAGDTVSVAPGTYTAGTVVTASGTADAPITLETGKVAGYPTAAAISAGTGPGIEVSGAQYVDIEGFAFGISLVQSSVLVTGSSHVTVDRTSSLNTLFNVPAFGTGQSPIQITGSSEVTVSRNLISGPHGAADIGVAGPGSDDVVTTNLLENNTTGEGVAVSGVTGADVTANTIVAACSSLIDLSAGATGASIENNVVEGVLRTTGCPTAAHRYLVSVDASSATGTTLDYNDAYTPEVPDFAYDWSGTAYDTAAELSAATGQGVHDSNAAPEVDNLGRVTGVANSPVIDSANADAPGELPTDLNGNPPTDDPLVPNTGTGAVDYADRGAVENQDSVTLALSGQTVTQMPVGAALTDTFQATSAWYGTSGMTYSFDYGDTTSSQSGSGVFDHVYASQGSYEPFVTATEGASGATGKWQMALVTVVPDGPFTAALTATPSAAMTVFADAHATVDPWNITGYSYDFGDGTGVATGLGDTEYHTYAHPGTYTVTVTANDSDGRSQTVSKQVTTAGADFTPDGPTRVLDTRSGTGAAKAQVAAGGVVVVKLAGTGTIPAGVTAVAVNLTATNTHGSGNVIAYADGAARPGVSNLNYTAGATVANEAVVPVGADGSIDLFTTGSGAGAIDLIADVTGYFSPTTASGYQPLSPARLLDTRNGTGAAEAKVGAGKSVRLTIAGADSGDLPASGITAVALHVTTTDTSGTGFITAIPDGAAVPSASNLNYTPSSTVSNTVIVPLGADGAVDLVNGGTSAGPVDLIADVVGYYGPAAPAAYVPITPVRELDTRTGSPLAAGATATVNPDATDPDIAAAIVTGYAMNVTATGSNATGNIVAYGVGSPEPAAAAVNYAPGTTTANLAQIQSGAEGVDFTNTGSTAGPVQLIVDLFGYYSVT